MSTIKIDPSGHVLLAYVGDNGLRETFDLTVYIDEYINERLAKNATEAVAAHERKLHGHQL